MARLKVRGIHCADTASEFSSDEVGTIDDTFLFPKWWDKKGNNVEYIRVFKLHMTRVCDDIDLIIPANADIEIRGDYDGNVGFRIDYHRGVERMAITAHDSTQVDAEYIFPTRPRQKPRYVEYGAGPVVCFAVAPLGSWATFVIEHHPNLDLGDLSPADGFYDLNQEQLNGFDMGDLPEPPSNITDLGNIRFSVSLSPNNSANLTVNQTSYAGIQKLNSNNNSVDSDLFNFAWRVPPFIELVSGSTLSDPTLTFKATRLGSGYIYCDVTIKDPDNYSMHNPEPVNVSQHVYALA